MISPSQMRAARQLLNVSQQDVAEATGLSVPTIRRAESEREVPISEESIRLIQSVLEGWGAEFIVGPKKVGVMVRYD